MDHHFLKFLGNYFINAAVYQKQADNMVKWINQGGSGFEEISSMFKKFYNIDGNTSSDEFARTFQEFKKNYSQFFTLPGMVSEKKYLELEQEYEKLKEKYDQQKEIIDNLSSIITMKDTLQNNMNQGIEHVMKNQKKIFENMLNGFNPKKSERCTDDG